MKGNFIDIKIIGIHRIIGVNKDMVDVLVENERDNFKVYWKILIFFVVIRWIFLFEVENKRNFVYFNFKVGFLHWNNEVNNYFRKVQNYSLIFHGKGDRYRFVMGKMEMVFKPENDYDIVLKVFFDIKESILIINLDRVV